MSETERPLRQRRRRRYTVSLRMLMLLVLVAEFCLGWKVNRAHTQARAVALIKEAGGVVSYNHQLDSNLESRLYMGQRYGGHRRDRRRSGARHIA
jgi:hypothetical protein